MRKVWVRLLIDSGIYEEFHGANWPTLEARGVPEDARDEYGKVRRFSDGLAANLDGGRGLILRGDVGRMKTTLAVAVGQEALLIGRRVRKVNAAMLLDELWTLRDTNREGLAQMERDLKDVKLLILDDLGHEGADARILTKLKAILVYRHERKRSTIITSNLSGSQMKDTYALHIIDRLKSRCVDIHTFSGESLRPKQDQGGTS